MHVTVARVHENLFDGEATKVNVPTTGGDIGILPHHEPLVATIKNGSLVISHEKGEEVFNVESGVVEVSNNQVTVIL
jgi:F-type H+-transporting ATPase subunit epsilon